MPLKQHSNIYKHTKHIKIIHDKNYKYALNNAINACVSASFIPSRVEVGLTPYLAHKNM